LLILLKKINIRIKNTIKHKSLMVFFLISQNPAAESALQRLKIPL
jgi:hypothetical protein